MSKAYSMVIKCDQRDKAKNVVRVVHTCCWEIKVTKVLQDPSNLKASQLFKKMFISVWCKVSFYTWSSWRAARRLDNIKKVVSISS